MTPPSRMSRAEFLAAFGGVYEHSPWIAEAAWTAGIGTEQDGNEGLSAAMSMAVTNADKERQFALLRAHPDLAGKLALAGEVTRSSQSEQSSAGLDQCTPEELRRFHELNDAYKKKFGFPFILAVRGLGRGDILQAFERRIGNDVESEFAEALAQVNKIARLRIARIMDGAA